MGRRRKEEEGRGGGGRSTCTYRSGALNKLSALNSQGLLLKDAAVESRTTWRGIGMRTSC